MQTPFKLFKVADGPDLLRHLEVYLTSLKPIPAGSDFVDGKVVKKYVPRPPSVSGFMLYLGLAKSYTFLSLRQMYPAEFNKCIEIIRKTLLEKPTNKKFAKQIAKLPLLDLRVTSPQYKT